MGTGCPYCSGRKAIVGVNDLLTINPQLASQANGWDPTTVKHKSQQKLLWLCGLGHEWRETVANRTAGSGCPVCSNQQVLKGVNDLATLFPSVAEEAVGWDPTSIIPGSGKKLKWQCGLGHLYIAAPTKRTGQSSSGCPYCANIKVMPGFNDLKSRYPVLAAEAEAPSAMLIV